MNVQRVTHLGICVANLERSLAFYRDVLEFVEVGRLEVDTANAPTSGELLGIPGVKLQAIYLERDGWRIELLYYPTPGHVGGAEPRPMNALGLTHLSLRVADLDAVIAGLEAAGGRVLARTESPEHGTRAWFATDPDGTRLELIQAPGDPNAVPGLRGAE